MEETNISKKLNQLRHKSRPFSAFNNVDTVAY